MGAAQITSTIATVAAFWFLGLFNQAADERRDLADDLYRICKSAPNYNSDVSWACEMRNEAALDAAARRARKAEARTGKK